ncbi:MAG: insulinase family protein [Porticoccaceae bacterium]
MSSYISRSFIDKKLPCLLIFSLFLFITTSCSSKLLISTTILETEAIVKSANDQRQYQRIQLPNNLDVVLISDPTTDKAAAALDLYVGSYQNPKQRQGLAHFLEHMLFLGTKQFPKADAYQTFISEHGGSHNASTALEHTNYFFDVNADSLTQALDRFAPFFTDPLFDANYVDRERNAVESEYQLKYKNDGRRQWDVLREIANPQHPLSKFNVGSLDTLSDNKQSSVREELIEFYDKYYSANLMTLVVLGKQPLDQLDKIVRARFSDIQDKQVAISDYKSSYIESSALPMQVNIKPLKDTRKLSLLFELPKLNSYWQSKPAQYLASMIGYEGQGSLLQALKSKGWAESLSAGKVLEDRGAGLFAVDIGLTPEGYKAREQVLIELFAWIKLIKDKGIEKWRQNEYAAMGDIGFRFAEKQDPASYVTAIARAMHQYKDGEILRAPYVASQFDRAIINTVISSLTPTNMLMLVSAPEARVVDFSKYYQAPYLAETLYSGFIDRIVHGSPFFDLSLADPNPYIPDDLTLIDLPSYLKPALYIDNPGLRVWHLQNTQFGTPKAQIVIRLNSHLTQSLKGLSAARLYTAYITDQLNEDLYPAVMAGLNYRLSANEQGLSIVINGYSDKQEILLQRILSMITAPSWNKDQFELIKQQLIREKNNAKRDYPFRQVISFFYSILEGRWTAEDQAKTLFSIDIADLQKFSKELLSSVSAKVLVAGNHHQASLDRIIAQFDLIDFKDIAHTSKVAKLEQADIVRSIEVDHNDAVLIQYIQADNDSIKERATVGLLSQMISAPFYNQLRTEKQLGYVVSAFAMPINRVPGICMLVQSPVATAPSLKTEFNVFNQGFSNQVENLSVEVLDKHKRALLINIEKSPDNLSELNSRHLQSIKLGYVNFDFRDQLAASIRSITVGEIQAAYKRLVLNKPRRLWVKTQDKDAVNSQRKHDVAIEEYYMFPN